MIYLEPIQISRHLCILHKDFTINCKVTLAPPKLDDVTLKKKKKKNWLLPDLKEIRYD